jgi:hypothetical protein
MIRVRTNPLRLERVTKDIAKDIKASKKRAMTRTVLAGVEIIENRTAQGKGIRGAFKSYSKSWANVRRDLGLETSKVTLEFGYERKAATESNGSVNISSVKERYVKRPSMLAALQGKVVNRHVGEIFFSRADAAKRAAMVNEKRKFFGFSRDEQKQLASVYFSGIKIKDRRR